MQTSQSIKEISTALVGFHKEVGKVGKDSANPFFKNKYASLSNILETIQEPLSANNLALLQFPEGENGLTTRLVHTSGEWMEATYNMQPVKGTPQDRGSAITYQRRYAVAAVLSLTIDEDDDGNAASGKKKETAKTEEPKPVPPNIFKRKYETAQQVSEALSQATEIKQAASLYHVNAELIEQTDWLKAEFTTRKNQLYNSQLPATIQG